MGRCAGTVCLTVLKLTLLYPIFVHIEFCEISHYTVSWYGEYVESWYTGKLIACISFWYEQQPIFTELKLYCMKTSMLITVIWYCIETEIKYILKKFSSLASQCTGSCQNDRFWCRQFWWFCQNNEIFFSVWTNTLQHNIYTNDNGTMLNKQLTQHTSKIFMPFCLSISIHQDHEGCFVYV